MQLKKLIPACLALVMLCGCSSNNSSTSSKKDNNKSSDTVTEKVDAKDLTTVKGTMSVPENTTSLVLDGSTIEYTVDKNGLVHSINFHKVTGVAPYDDEKSAKSLAAGRGSVYLNESKIPEWKKDATEENSFKGKGYSITATIGDKLSTEQSQMVIGEDTAYTLTLDCVFDSSKATTKSANDFAMNISDSVEVKSKNNTITEKSLKKMLENYYMTYTNE